MADSPGPGATEITPPSRINGISWEDLSAGACSVRIDRNYRHANKLLLAEEAGIALAVTSSMDSVTPRTVPAQTTWSLVRDGHTMTCTLVTSPVRRYSLRLSFDGRFILNEFCDTPHRAVARSLEAFGALLVRGWREDVASN